MTVHYDPSSFTNKAEENGFNAGAHSNWLANAAATIMERFAAAKASSRQSLESLRDVGDTLNDAKETLKADRGAFGAWCEASGFPFDKTWRARLMKLAANWDAIMEAVAAVPEDRKSWSVDGVLAIWAAAEKAKAGPAEGGEGADGEGAEAEPKPKKETEAEKLRRLLAEALARIETLEAEVAKARTAGAKEEPKARAKAEEPKPGTVDAATKARARKVWGLYTKGATDGEKGAAKGRLEDMARKFGMDFETFCKSCGLH